jgi:hypothetical protein
MSMILPILCGVLILGGFVALFLSRTTWPIYQIVLVLFLLLADAAFFYLAAGALHMHREWRSEVKKYEAAYAQQYALYKQLTGELDGKGEVVVDREEKLAREMNWTVDDWKDELAAAMYGRGRVISIPAPPRVDQATGALQATAAEAVTLPKDSTVYVFQTQPPRERRFVYKKTEVPIATPPIVRFVGTYIVTNVANNQVELAPLYAEQKTAVNGPLAIYELAPVDSHVAFAHLSEADIRSLLPDPVPPEIVEQYVKDGKPVADPASEPAERVWRRVRFKKPYTVSEENAKRVVVPPIADRSPAGAEPAGAEPVDGAAAEPAADPAQAVVKAELVLNADDQALLDPATAERLVMDGTAEYVPNQPEENIFSHVYVRPLVDYPSAFRAVRTQLIATNLKTGQVEGQLQSVQTATQHAQQTEKTRKEEAERLKKDLAGFTYEAQAMEKLHAAFETSVRNVHAQIGALAQSIFSQADELSRLQHRAAQAAEPSPRGAAAAVSTR